jgi:hypothetical protein
MVTRASVVTRFQHLCNILNIHHYRPVQACYSKSGYFAPADVSGMVLYLQTLADYEAARQRTQRASSVEKQIERREARAITRQIISLLRALRMFPSTRAHSMTLSRLANHPAKQVLSETDEPEWQNHARQ